MKKQIYSVCCFAALAGCSASTPPSLVDARAAYQRAAQGPAAQLTPAQLHVAQTYLTLAEETFKDEGDSQNTRDRAYVAERKAQLAEVQANIVSADSRETAARKQAENNRARQEAATRQTLNQAQQEIAQQSAALAAERQRREDAERRAQQAISQLDKIASVKQEPRGTVITLSGSVIFASGKSQLLPSARQKLDQVADALKKSSPDSKFLVEGYTDSRGPLSLNEELSKQRAASVRDYLVTRGVPEERITSEGLGPSNPVADNNTPEGRANNRRVEIVVQSGGTGNQNRGEAPKQRSQNPSGSSPQTKLEKVEQPIESARATP